ncbi:MAG: zf-TFIIB domain-containing protein [Candidatus Margulisiibacteriota bacterium]
MDYCPQCRGVWLDDGELDKIIEHTALARGGSEKHRECRDHDNDEYHDKSRRREKGGFLGELFDFD